MSPPRYRSIAAYLGGARVLRSRDGAPSGNRIQPHSPAPVEQQVAALERLTAPASTTCAGVLPGAAGSGALIDLRSLARRHGWSVLPLHASSPEEQDRAVSPLRAQRSSCPTNVAEAHHYRRHYRRNRQRPGARRQPSPWSGLPILQVGRISQASANQRAGRAATAPGRASASIRWTTSCAVPPRHPEVMRADLSPRRSCSERWARAVGVSRMAGCTARRPRGARRGTARRLERTRSRTGKCAVPFASAFGPIDRGSAPPEWRR